MRCRTRREENAAQSPNVTRSPGGQRLGAVSEQSLLAAVTTAVRDAFPSPVTARSNRDVVARLRAGEADAFREVYESERRVLYGFLVRLCGDANVAADLFQNTWLKLVRNASNLREDTSVRAWLLTVARREAISHRRARLLDVSRFLEVSSATEASSPSDAALFELRSALDRLAPRDREVLLLTCVQGLSGREAADALGIAEAALRQRVRRARRRLSEMWSGLPAVGDGAEA